jgi:hypothetical protein
MIKAGNELDTVRRVAVAVINDEHADGEFKVR